MEKYSEDYYEEAHRNWFAHPNMQLFRWIEGQLPKTMRSLVDIGCGRGQFLDFLRGQRPDILLVGVDLSSNADRNGIAFHCGSALELDLGKFDAVVSLATIEHVADANGFAARLYSLCSPGGVVFVMTLDDSSLLYRIARVARQFGMPLAFDRLYSAHHFHHFTHKSLSLLLELNGLKIRQTLRHSVPVRAIDVPIQNFVFRPLVLAAAATLLAAGDLTGWSYLQTIVAVRPADG
jgi:2-polyprenyl-3-methyl-5-hydroxy-6-metoxy-1,4-benzoquinol methylase